jgi:hypothetical protein
VLKLSGSTNTLNECASSSFRIFPRSQVGNFEINTIYLGHTIVFLIYCDILQYLKGLTIKGINENFLKPRGQGIKQWDYLKFQWSGQEWLTYPESGDDVTGGDKCDSVSQGMARKGRA